VQSNFTHIKYNKIKNKILVNCLKLGKNPKFTNKKLTKYIYGTRNNVELFNVTELQYIMYRIYPFIKTLFKNYRLNYLNIKSNRKKKYSNSILNKLETSSVNKNNSEKNQEIFIS
jgi:ribosomal protein S2